MKVLITGSRGFVGAETVRQMRNENDAMPEWDMFPYDLMDGFDIRDRKQLRRAVEDCDPDRILHLAAIARFADADRDPLLAWETNVTGTANVVKVAAEYHVPLVFASTGSAIMPLDAYEPPYAESIPPRGNSVYGCSKAIGELLVRTHTPHIILRYAHIYGKEKRGHGLIGGFVQRIERGLQPTLYGGAQSNDFTHVSDIAQANILALAAPWDKWGQTYHIGTGEELTAEAAGRAVCEVLGWTGGIHVEAPRTVDPGRFVFDISKAKTWLGYSPQYTFEAGLREMLA